MRRVPLVFLGSPPVAADVLRKLVGAGHDVRLVVTAPERRRGRGSSTSPTAVGAAATELGIEVSHDVADVLKCGAELGVIVAFGRIIRSEVLDRIPMVNIHFSLLPRWRGAAPVERAILAGDAVTGVCLMAVVPELDAGGVYASAELPLEGRNAVEATQQLGQMGASLLLEALELGLGDPVEQSGPVTYAEKLSLDELRLDWSLPAELLLRVVRTTRAWTTWRGERIRIVDAHIIDDRLVPTVVQPAGRQRVDAESWWRGARADEGEWFT